MYPIARTCLIYLMLASTTSALGVPALQKPEQVAAMQYNSTNQLMQSLVAAQKVYFVAKSAYSPTNTGTSSY